MPSAVSMLDTVIVSLFKKPLSWTVCPACSVRLAKVLVLNFVDLTTTDKYELSAVLYACQGTIVIGHRRGTVFGSHFVLCATHAVAYLAGPGAIRRRGRHQAQCQHKSEKHCFHYRLLLVFLSFG